MAKSPRRGMIDEGGENARSLGDGETPAISVIVATRNRPWSIADTVETILCNEYANYELIVVDQTEGSQTQEALERFLSNRRLRYIHTSTTGLQIARNLGTQAARHELIVTTDDDCVTPPDWLRRFAEMFAVDHRIAIVFGNVLEGTHDRNAGFIPSYRISEPLIARHVGEKHLVEGMGACFGFRKAVWQSLNGFDPTLGRGARFQSAGETDFAIRALLSGYFVYQAPHVEVVHNGFRTWAEGNALIQGYLYGVGAVYLKNLRQGRWSVLPDLCSIARRFIRGHRLVGLGHRSHSIAKLLGFLRGATAGWRTPLDSKTGHFRVSK